MLQGHDAKATNAFVELDRDSEEVIKKLEKIRTEAVRSEIRFTDLSHSAAEITTVEELKQQTQYWAFQMNDAGHRIGYEVDAIRSTLLKMRTFVAEKNAMIAYLVQSVEDVRFLHNRLQAKPITESTETQTDAIESSIDVSHNREILLFNYLFSSVSLIFESFSMKI